MRKVTGLLFVVICGIALASCANSHADLQTAKAARQNGDYETARRHLEPMAAFGLPEAQVELARVLLADKKAPEEDLERARQLLESAAEKQNEQAYFDLGRLYERGRGVKRDYKTAQGYYEKSYALGYDRGLFYAARMLEKQKKYKDAEALYIRSYHGKYYKAARAVAVLYEKGRGRERDPVGALAWYIAAQSHGVEGLEKKIARLERILGPGGVTKAKEISEGL